MIGLFWGVLFFLLVSLIIALVLSSREHMENGRKPVFGPQFNGVGEGGNVDEASPDTSKNNVYPKLLGGGESKPTRRIPGAGIVGPSNDWYLQTSGMMPDSQTPGDKDLIPDPYRVANTYSPANNAYKTDPVPFLSDFSPFQK